MKTRQNGKILPPDEKTLPLDAKILQKGKTRLLEEKILRQDVKIHHEGRTRQPIEKIHPSSRIRPLGKTLLDGRIHLVAAKIPQLDKIHRIEITLHRAKIHREDKILRQGQTQLAVVIQGRFSIQIKGSTRVFLEGSHLEVETLVTALIAMVVEKEVEATDLLASIGHL